MAAWDGGGRRGVGLRGRGAHRHGGGGGRGDRQLQLSARGGGQRRAGLCSCLQSISAPLALSDSAALVGQGAGERSTCLPLHHYRGTIDFYIFFMNILFYFFVFLYQDTGAASEGAKVGA